MRIAEETGLIVGIGRWILGEAAARASEWVRQSPRAFVRVNVSARQLRDPGFPDDVAAALRAAQLDPARLVLESTETSVMEDIERTLATFRAIKALGVRLAIDAFGTGFSSLSYLHLLPFDILRIDGSFVRRTADDGSAEPSALLRAIVELGRTMGLAMIAEGRDGRDGD